MPTAGTVNANDLLLYIDDVAVGCLTSLDWAGTNEKIDVTCKDDNGAEKSLAGQQTSAMNFGGWLKFDVATQFPLLIASWKAKTAHDVKISTEVVGDISIGDNSYIDTLNLSGGVNEGASFTGSWAPSSASTGALIVTIT